VLTENKKNIEKLNEELIEKKKEFNKIVEEYNDYKKKCDETLEVKIKEINVLNVKIKDLEKDIKSYKIKETALTEEIDIWRDNEKKLKDTYGDLHYSLLVAQEENKNYKSKIEEYETKCKNFENKVKQLQSNLYALVENQDTEINSNVLFTGNCSFYIYIYIYIFKFEKINNYNEYSFMNIYIKSI